MIKSIERLRTEAPELFGAVYQRLCDHPAWNDFCRYTFAELQELAGSLNGVLSRFGDSRAYEYRQQFTIFELNTMDRLLRLSGEARIGAIRRHVATAVERTTRYLEDLKSVHVAEEKLRAGYQELQSKRSRVGAPTLEERFTE